MSCSLMTASVGGLEAGFEAEHRERDLGLRQRSSASGQAATFARLASPWSASTWLMRSRAPSLHSAITTRLPAACSAWTCLVTASNTFASASARSAAKLRPCRVPTSTRGLASGIANGVSRASARVVEPLAPFGLR